MHGPRVMSLERGRGAAPMHGRRGVQEHRALVEAIAPSTATALMSAHLSRTAERLAQVEKRRRRPTPEGSLPGIDTAPPKPVIVGLDGSKSDAVSFGAAAEEAARRKTSLVAVHAWLITDDDLPVEGGVRIDPAIEVRLARELDRTVNGLAAGTGVEHQVETRVLYGYAGHVLSGLSQQAELLVMAGHGKGAWRGLLLGSVTQYVVEHASCPVMVVHGVAAGIGGQVVVGVDGSPASLAALRWARQLATSRRVALTAVRAGGPSLERALFPEPSSTAALGTWTAQARRDLTRWLDETLPAGSRAVATAVVNPGSPAAALLEQVDEHDVVVVGRRGAGGFPGLHLGSVARRVICQAPGAAVVVPPGWLASVSTTTT